VAPNPIVRPRPDHFSLNVVVINYVNVVLHVGHVPQFRCTETSDVIVHDFKIGA